MADHGRRTFLKAMGLALGGLVTRSYWDVGLSYERAGWAFPPNWLHEAMEEIFRYGGKEKILWVDALGEKALSAMYRTALSRPAHELGFEEKEIVSPFGTLRVHTHPLLRPNTGIVVDQDRIRACMINLDPTVPRLKGGMKDMFHGHVAQELPEGTGNDRRGGLPHWW